MQKVSTDEWVEFKIIDLFTVINTHSILKSSIDEGSGNIPYVTASNTNNGVYAYISFDEAYIEKGNAIMIGGKTLTVTYQSQDFVSNDSHNLVLYLKDETKRTKNIQLFLVSVIATCLGKIYSWGDSISYKSIQKEM